jgi:hypothetical protein
MSSKGFVKVAQFDSRLEAEAVGHALDQYEIPFLVKSEDLGIFGPGHTGATPQGATLLVPAQFVSQVRELFDCLAKDEGLSDASSDEPDE